jgi:hypothetical protein
MSISGSSALLQVPSESGLFGCPIEKLLNLTCTVWLSPDKRGLEFSRLKLKLKSPNKIRGFVKGSALQCHSYRGEVNYVAVNYSALVM